MSPQPLPSVFLLTRVLCSTDRAWGLIYHVCIPQHQTGLGTVTEARLTAEMEPTYWIPHVSPAALDVTSTGEVVGGLQ